MRHAWNQTKRPETAPESINTNVVFGTAPRLSLTYTETEGVVWISQTKGIDIWKKQTKQTKKPMTSRDKYQKNIYLFTAMAHVVCQNFRERNMWMRRVIRSRLTISFSRHFRKKYPCATPGITTKRPGTHQRPLIERTLWQVPRLPVLRLPPGYWCFITLGTHTFTCQWTRVPCLNNVSRC